MAYHKNKYDLGKAFTKSYNTAYKSITKRQKEYKKAYRTLQEAGQNLGKFKTMPSNKDIGTLKARISTMKEYEKVYRRYEKSVKGFNQKYYGDITKPEPHQQKNLKTYKSLVEQYENWKNWRRKYVRNIPQEVKITERNIKEVFEDIQSEINRQDIDTEGRKKRKYYAEARTKRAIVGDFVKNITRIFLNFDEKQKEGIWKDFSDGAWAFILSSKQDLRREGWTKLSQVLTGGGAEPYPEFMVKWEKQHRTDTSFDIEGDYRA